MATTPLKGENVEGEVMHVRIPVELCEALRKLSRVSGRPKTAELVFQLDRALLGPRELRLINGKLREN
jgi:hypothetical protein